jgi:hypothetical protein
MVGESDAAKEDLPHGAGENGGDVVVILPMGGFGDLPVKFKGYSLLGHAK